jgi:hypothetical protein
MELRRCWSADIWPELHVFEGIGLSGRLFSKREGQSNEIGEILRVWNANAQSTTRHNHLAHEEGDGLCLCYTTVATVYVDWLLPRPILPVYEDASLGEYAIPARFENIIALNAAGRLHDADGRALVANKFYADADQELNMERARIQVPERLRRFLWQANTMPTWSQGGNPTGGVSLAELLIEHGSHQIPDGAEGETFTVSFSEAPTQVFLNVRKPSGGLELWATAVAPYSATEITFTLNGLTDSGDYWLDYIAVFGN